MNPAVPIALFIALLVTGYALASRFNVNEFSMHNFYRNRLVRAYLGASRERRTRRPNPFTGFDELDDIALAKLRVSENYFGPFPIVNAAVNITKGQDLATQERMAESFSFTPLRCGFDFFRPQPQPSRSELARYGYQEPEWTEFNAKQGARLGTTMAISGAAVSPNMGYHSKPVVAFLLSLFNVRLGFWVRNPANRETTGRQAPELGPLYLFRELLGSMDVRSTYLNLSDGGHFENIGLYELVRRRCRFIIVSDAEQDGEFGFGGMGSAIRKCRNDFGVEISIDLKSLCPKESEISPNHFAVGTIRYPEDPDKLGYVLYLKASITGDEPGDVLEYRNRFKDFPHQSTLNQFFTESQFESYRALGYHIATQAVPRSDADFGEDGGIESFFKNLRGQAEREHSEVTATGDRKPIVSQVVKRKIHFLFGAANGRK